MRLSILLGASTCFFAVVSSVALGAPPTSITLDGSLGHAPGVLAPTSPGLYQITPGMGKSVGANLFQSFGTFNLGTGDTASFLADTNTQNIIARVTGGSASNIDGTLQSPVNLFFINPAGIMFTANAALNVNGAFVASTANYVKMNDGTIFYADVNHPINDAGLSSAPVSAFGFMPGNTPQPITFTGTQFNNPGGIHVIAGDITLDQGTQLLAPSGYLTLFSTASAGEVPFDLSSPGSGYANATNSTFGNITIQNQSRVAIDGAGGGKVVIRGGALVVDNSTISSNNSGSVAGGNITATLSGMLHLTDSGNITADALNSGDGGEVSVVAQSVAIEGTAAPGQFTGIASDSESGATGNSGGVSINATNGPVSISAGGIIRADTSSAGNAGNVGLQADSLSIDGSTAIGLFTGISSSCNAGATASAHGGLISLTLANAVSITGGGTISATTFSAGNAGEIDLQAGSLTIDGTLDGSTAIANFTGIASDCELGSSGNGGSIMANVAGEISILNGGTIDTDTDGSGQAGNITVTHADSLDINGAGALAQFTGLSSVSDTNATGNGGNINLTVAKQVSITGTGVIEADTFSSGAAGTITLQADSMTIDGSIDPLGLTGIASNSDPTSSNNGGDVTITLTHNLICTGGGGIDSQAFSTGNGGNVSVTAGGSISLTDGGYVDADTYSSGNGGTLVVSALSINIDGSGLAGVGFVTGIDSDSSVFYTASATGNGGSVNVTANQTLTMVNGGTVAASTETLGNGGNVVVNVPGEINLSSGAQITAASSSSATNAGQAGSVTIKAGSVEMNDANVATSAVAANAGSIEITAGNGIDLMNGSSITTSAGLDGGDITLRTNSLVYLFDSKITSAANGGSQTSGGNILFDPEFVVLDNSPVSANDPLGTGGNILVLSSYMFNPNNSMTASGATDGVVSTPPPDLNLAASLVAQHGELVKAENRLREQCARSVNHEFSSLIVVGRGGTEPAPDELQPDFGVSAVSPLVQ